ncbi:uncharacterized protein PHACADRAFT_253262 [Phanerochaete carnosa HHB-10118-sp]|uniref:G-alpha-domain-containing protein n=1 Tax=Phanerochaete carnosa (strain HHB-10118-sp) TaxID=650164 RepID=K5WB81_PHACS|nr:uncharacterized protein PHACADRAFT_253262 [Phanerochaete carnosa HHB-10118-sp]EKM56244.1 hypothetical protein PHACADRAFT_253262 [Phanerochaete carnosa HHB-10118-sp]
MKMLLLGQSESGKSTTLKTMQMAYTPKAWAQERASWKAVIQLNLIRSINTIVDALAEELSAPQSPATRHSLHSSDEGHSPPTDQLLIPQDRRGPLMMLRMRLTPLRQVETDLKMRLGAGADEIVDASLMSGVEAMMATPFDDSTYPTPSRRFTPKEAVVRSHRAWKEREKARKEKDRALTMRPNSPSDPRDTATDVLVGCADDMSALWLDPVVRDIVRRRRVMSQLGDSAEYFLTCISRIATRDYKPSDNDVLRARIRTLGVQEYNLTFEVYDSLDDTRGLAREWAIYDVGGSRTSRAAWLPYFSDINCILFLAPISAFDERLAEDKRINRLEDSFILWLSICKSELLKGAIFILFMNKCDLLESKINAGIQVSRYMTSYGSRPNDFASFSSYLKTKFKDVQSANSPEKRAFYGYMTSVVDYEATAKTLASVRDGIIQLHLRDAAFVG